MFRQPAPQGESVIQYEAENRVPQERTILWWVWGASYRKRGVGMRMPCRSLPRYGAEHRRSGLEFGIHVTRKGSRWKGSFSDAFLLGSVEHPDTVQGLNRGQGFIQKQQALYKDGPRFSTDEKYFEGVQRTATCSLMAACWIF